MFNFFFALNIVKVEGVDLNYPKKDFKDINFSKEVAILPADYLEYVIKHKNLKIIG